MFLSTTAAFVLCFNIIINHLTASYEQRHENYKRITLAQELTPAESLNFLIFHTLPERMYYSNNLNGYVVKGTSITDEENTDNKGNDNNVENKDDNSNLDPSLKENDNDHVPPSDSNKKTDNQKTDENEDKKDEKKDDKPNNSFSFGSLFWKNDDGENNEKDEKKEDSNDGIIKAISKEIDDIENGILRYAIKLLPGGKEALDAMDTGSNVAKTGSKVINKFN